MYQFKKETFSPSLELLFIAIRMLALQRKAGEEQGQSEAVSVPPEQVVWVHESRLRGFSGGAVPGQKPFHS